MATGDVMRSYLCGIATVLITVAPAGPAAATPATPVTPAIRGTPATPAEPPKPAAPPACRVTERLVPQCGILWGAAAGAYSGVPRGVALRAFEWRTGRAATVYHAFHRGDELFPTADEIMLTVEPGRPRLLFVNWKVAWHTTWARVAAGEQDERIDRLAGHLNRYFPRPFFLALHHEPEDDVDERPGSGMSAADYAAMFAHTVNRLRAAGATQAVAVMAYMGSEKWPAQPWWPRLYPGDDVVDWIALDSYLRAEPGYHYGDFADLLERRPARHDWPGYYTWATTNHPDKPFMLAEWGVLEYPADRCHKARIYRSVTEQLARFPALKAMFYFDGENLPQPRGGDTRPDSSPEALAEFRNIAANPVFDVAPLRARRFVLYGRGPVTRAG
jgi:hypothetical protein